MVLARCELLCALMSGFFVGEKKDEEGELDGHNVTLLPPFGQTSHVNPRPCPTEAPIVIPSNRVFRTSPIIMAENETDCGHMYGETGHKFNGIFYRDFYAIYPFSDSMLEKILND